MRADIEWSPSLIDACNWHRVVPVPALRSRPPVPIAGSGLEVPVAQEPWTRPDERNARQCGPMDHPVSNDDNAQSIMDLVDSMMHAPHVVPIGERLELEQVVLVLRHVEIWRWRIVLSATRANREAPTLFTAPVEPQRGESGAKVLNVERFDLDNRRHESHRWLSEWSVDDDLGTSYRLVSGHGGGSGGDWWTDLAVQFEPAPPPHASSLTFHGPDGLSRTIELSAGQPS